MRSAEGVLQGGGGRDPASILRHTVQPLDTAGPENPTQGCWARELQKSSTWRQISGSGRELPKGCAYLCLHVCLCVHTARELCMHVSVCTRHVSICACLCVHTARELCMHVSVCHGT